MKKIEITVEPCDQKWTMDASGIFDVLWVNAFSSDKEVEDFLTSWLSRILPKKKVEDCVGSWKDFCNTDKNEFTWSS